MILTIIAVFLGILRVAGLKHIAFQAVAHLYVGFLFGGWAVSPAHDHHAERKSLFLILALTLTTIEFICFAAPYIRK